MARTNTKQKRKTAQLRTHEGGPARRITAYEQLRRSVLATMLFEGTFYESGQSIATRIRELVGRNDPEDTAKLAVEARTKYKLRHAPLWVTAAMTSHPEHLERVAETLVGVVNRPDELGEFLAMYRETPLPEGIKLEKGRKRPIANQVKRGLADAFRKFDEYQLRKYAGRDGAIRLRDVMFLVHPKPESNGHDGATVEPIDKKGYRRGAVTRHTGGMGAAFSKLAARNLKGADTWEANLSKGKGIKTEKDKKEVWTDMLKRKKLGAMALLRNLRNMREAGVDLGLIRTALKETSMKVVLPFRFIQAAEHAPELEKELETAMLGNLSGAPKLPGTTMVLVDHSGSMGYSRRMTRHGYGWISHTKPGELTNTDRAAALAMILQEVSEDCIVYAFSDRAKRVPSRRGFGLWEAIDKAMDWGGTHVGASFKEACREVKRRGEKIDRVVIITDEQAHDALDGPGLAGEGVKGYVLNVAPFKNGIGYGPWTHVDGFSEATVEYIRAIESEAVNVTEEE